MADVNSWRNRKGRQYKGGIREIKRGPMCYPIMKHQKEISGAN